MISFPNAKVNLGLHIVSKRPDGFHNLETVFAPIPFSDVLEIIPAKEETSFRQSGIIVDTRPDDNLCMKAYQLLKKDFPQIADVEMWLHKVIPFGAGLGGGSADASFTLRLLNDIFELHLSGEKLQQYASQLGSDCAFFIENKPMFAKGKGDEFEKIDLDVSNYCWVIVKPSFSISTPEAYAGITPKTPEIPLKEVIKLPVAEWKDKLTNDFENHLFVKYPELRNLKEQLYNSGAVYASLSGSGSALFGIFEKLDEGHISEHFPMFKLHYKNEKLLTFTQD
ncbi:4-(cytidine 5'-diphospho)-2-C-methyl-D-erythritol kinase [Bacteroidales bacterium OttesenSCG-928-C19]|nr:4-(cytidine 5'-diphospho)-2-C-methyl-D-erythritol kinase [Bacteroidales bacterium OttesenSCG-928-C19]